MSLGIPRRVTEGQIRSRRYPRTHALPTNQVGSRQLAGRPRWSHGGSRPTASPAGRPDCARRPIQSDGALTRIVDPEFGGRRGSDVLAHLRSSYQRISGAARVWLLTGALAAASSVVRLTASGSGTPPLEGVEVTWWMLALG